MCQRDGPPGARSSPACPAFLHSAAATAARSAPARVRGEPASRQAHGHPARGGRCGTLQKYLDDVRETDPLYAGEHIVHPGQRCGCAITALKDNVLLAPWIHTGSNVRFHALARFGDVLTVRGAVAKNYESKGHRIVDLDLTIVANDRTVIAQVLHTAIYQLRHLAG